MAPDRGSQEYIPLRVITQRISSTSIKQLPTAVPHLVNLLGECRQVLSFPEDSRTKQTPEAVSIHKYRTQISTLLNDKSIEARWAAAVLVKTSIDVGGYETLHRCGPWVRALLANLNKHDPPTSKRLYVITLTKIFTLTHEYPTLIREITTPSLPSFITSCLNIMSPKRASTHKPDHTVVISLLECLRGLLPHHPSVFRSFAAQLKVVTMAFISNTSVMSGGPSNGIHTSAQLNESAQALFALLHYCAPKQTSGEEWRKTSDLVISECHKIADKLFRSVVEERDVILGTQGNVSVVSATSQDLRQDPQDSALGLQGWVGVHPGAEVLRRLLRLLLQLVRSQTASPVSFGTGSFSDILYRVLSLSSPSKADSKVARGFGYNAKFNDAVSREEREGLFSELPSLHATALDVLEGLCDRFGLSYMPMLQSTLDLVVWVFSCEHSNPSVRTRSYALVSKILDIIGPSLMRPQVRHLEGVIRSCCDELLQLTDRENIATNLKPNGQEIVADNFLQTSKASVAKPQNFTAKFPAQRSATILLTTFLGRVPSMHISPRLRAQLDRTAILTGAADAMIASVLNCGPAGQNRSKTQHSILPFLSRAHPEHMATEALLKPRMPVIQNGPYNNHKGEHDAEVDEDLDDDQSMLDTGQTTTWTSAFARDSPEDELSSNPERQPERDLPKEDPATLIPELSWSTDRLISASEPAQRDAGENDKRRLSMDNNDSGTTPPAKRQHMDEHLMAAVVDPQTTAPSISAAEAVLSTQTPTIGIATASHQIEYVVKPADVDHPSSVAKPGSLTAHIASHEVEEASDDDENFVIPTLTLDSDDEDLEDV